MYKLGGWFFSFFTIVYTKLEIKIIIIIIIIMTRRFHYRNRLNDTYGEKVPLNKTPALMKSMNMDI